MKYQGIFASLFRCAFFWAFTGLMAYCEIAIEYTGENNVYEYEILYGDKETELNARVNIKSIGDKRVLSINDMRVRDNLISNNCNKQEINRILPIIVNFTVNSTGKISNNNINDAMALAHEKFSKPEDRVIIDGCIVPLLAGIFQFVVPETRQEKNGIKLISREWVKMNVNNDFEFLDDNQMGLLAAKSENDVLVLTGSCENKKKHGTEGKMTYTTEITSIRMMYDAKRNVFTNGQCVTNTIIKSSDRLIENTIRFIYEIKR